MLSPFRNFHRFLLAAVLAPPIFIVSGCAVHARVYDPYYHDYHVWDHETVYYNQWEHDTNRSHVAFDKRSDADKKAYWDYRHSQK